MVLLEEVTPIRAFKSPPNEEVIKALRCALRRAEAGDMQGFVLVDIRGLKGPKCYWAGQAKALPLHCRGALLDAAMFFEPEG